MSDSNETVVIDENLIFRLLSESENPKPASVHAILAKARRLEGLTHPEVAVLLQVEDLQLKDEIFHAARDVKDSIYGKRLVLFAPLYISNYCCNDCTYCAFRTGNRDIVRRALSQEEIANETQILVKQGHKRILLVTGESYPGEGISYILDSIKTVYNTKVGNGEIRRLNVNIAPLEYEEFRQLKAAHIGTYQLFQETYHRKTYAEVHLKGKKADFDNRITGIDRAIKAEIDDVGIGVLFGLYDWKFEVLAMLQHIHHLEAKFGIGPHTISVPRLEPALGSGISNKPPHAVSDSDFSKLVAILRLAVPYTGIIMSTRETPKVRRETFSLGVSQISAGSRTNPGGYSDSPFEGVSSQFQLGDHRTLDEVVQDVASLGYIPSFCTACYRLGRTGMDFMDLAKPGEIKKHCDPNALSTFLEYLKDYGSEKTVEIGEKLIKSHIIGMDKNLAAFTELQLQKIHEGKRDVYC
jgi:2-iminoacetate synthase